MVEGGGTKLAVGIVHEKRRVIRNFVVLPNNDYVL